MMGSGNYFFHFLAPAGEGVRVMTSSHWIQKVHISKDNVVEQWSCSMNATQSSDTVWFSLVWWFQMLLSEFPPLAQIPTRFSNTNTARELDVSV